MTPTLDPEEMFLQSRFFRPTLALHGFDDEREWEVRGWTYTPGDLKIEARLVGRLTDRIYQTAVIDYTLRDGEWKLDRLTRTLEHHKA